MNIEELLKIGAEAFSSKLGNTGELSTDGISGALSGLLGDGKGGLDLSGLLSNLNGAGLADLAQSWLGDGANNAVSTGQITDLFSADKLAAFAGQLGLAQDQAATGLSEAVPAMVDKASSGGQLLDSLGGTEGLMGAVGKLFGR